MEMGDEHHCSAALPPAKNSGTHLIGGWVGPKTFLYVLEKRRSEDSTGIRAPDHPVRSPLAIATTLPPRILELGEFHSKTLDKQKE
jgi:hypothetical protein